VRFVAPKSTKAEPDVKVVVLCQRGNGRNNGHRSTEANPSRTEPSKDTTPPAGKSDAAPLEEPTKDHAVETRGQP
jgi:hypothetical protein